MEHLEDLDIANAAQIRFRGPVAAKVKQCILSTVHLNTVLKAEEPDRSLPETEQGTKEANPTKSQQKSGKKNKRKRAKDYAKEEAEVQAALLLKSPWRQAWDPTFKTFHYYNFETQHSQWLAPDQPYLLDPKGPQSPSNASDLAYARATDFDVVQEAKTVGWLSVKALMGSEVSSQQPNAIEKLTEAVERLYKYSCGLPAQDVEATSSQPAEANSKEVDSLRARSTGLLPGIPEPRGTHLRFEDNAESLSTSKNETNAQASSSNDNRRCSSDSIQPPKSLLPSGHLELHQHSRPESSQEISQRGDVTNEESIKAVAQDIVEHTVDLSITDPEDAAEATDASLLPPKADTVLSIATSILAKDGSDPGPEDGTAISTADEHPLTPKSQHKVVATYEMLKETALSPEVCKTLVHNGPSAMMQENLQKYWSHRHHLWSKFEEGVMMDKEGWYSATPEALAAHQAERLRCNIAVDAFGGVGGNAIQLAKSCKQVIVSDVSMERLLLAKHNAQVYGTTNGMDFVCADFIKLAPRLQADAVFLSPPWGGPQYTRSGSYNVAEDLGGLDVSYKDILAVADSALHRSVLKPSSPPAYQRQQNLLDGTSVDGGAGGLQRATEAATAADRDREAAEVTFEADAIVVETQSNSQAAPDTENETLNEPGKNDDATCGRTPDKEAVPERNQPTPSNIGGTKHEFSEVKGIACFLPKNTNLAQLSEALPPEQHCEVERNFLNGRLISVSVYHGPCAEIP